MKILLPMILLLLSTSHATAQIPDWVTMSRDTTMERAARKEARANWNQARRMYYATIKSQARKRRLQAVKDAKHQRAINPPRSESYSRSYFDVPTHFGNFRYWFPF